MRCTQSISKAKRRIFKYNYKLPSDSTRRAARLLVGRRIVHSASQTSAVKRKRRKVRNLSTESRQIYQRDDDDEFDPRRIGHVAAAAATQWERINTFGRDRDRKREREREKALAAKLRFLHATPDCRLCRCMGSAIIEASRLELI